MKTSDTPEKPRKKTTEPFVRMLYRMLIFCIAGPFVEVFLSAWVRFFLKGNTTLHGGVSLYMMPVWSLMGCLLPLLIYATKSWRFPFFLRVLTYVIAFLAVEYFSGLFYRQLGLHIWDYSHFRYHLHGLICLNYAVPWFFVCCFAEYVYSRVDAMAWVLAHGASVASLEKHFNDDSQAG